MKIVALQQENKRIALLTLVFGGVWVLIPLIHNEFTLDNIHFQRSLKNFFLIALVITLNVKFLLKTLYYKGKTVAYILACIALIIGLSIINEYLIDPFFNLNKLPLRRRGGREENITIWRFVRTINRLMPIILSLAGSALFEISRFLDKKVKETILLKSEKLETEMKLLKSQINPHFLFNALNNVYSLSYLKPEKTPENLLKLSEMLRYMLYECDVEKVPLQKEITYLENFIHMKLLKDSRGMNVKVNLTKTGGHLMIAPMLLIPFVENAFKHSKVEDLQNGWITIDLTSHQQKIIFKVENSTLQNNYTKDQAGGIGLANVKRQLSLLYPQKHTLKIDSTEEKYSVHLEIELS